MSSAECHVHLMVVDRHVEGFMVCTCSWQNGTRCREV